MSVEIIECEQGSEQWLQARCGVPSASRFSDILRKARKKGEISEMRLTLLYTLCGERLTGKPAADYQYHGGALLRGKIMESEARALYGLRHDCDMQQVGFAKNGRYGASPDSLIGASGLLEIKTAAPHIQIDRLLSGVLPPEHLAQCQGQLWVCERQWLDFVSYWPGLPLFEIRVLRDEEYIMMLDAEVNKFCDELDALEKQLRKM